MKRFKALIYESEEVSYWQVWYFDGVRLTYRYAEFYGKHAQRFARDHAKLLNALPKKDQP